MANPKIEVEIGAKINKLLSDLNDAESALQKFGTNAINIGAGLTAAVTLPILAIGNATLKAASEAQGTASKFGVVFRDIQGSAEQSFQVLRNEYGLSATAAKQLLADTGNLLTGFGFSQKAALDLATQVGKLGVDLAAFSNFSGGAEGATEALTKALLGERESVKALGIAILEEDVKKQVAINTAKGLTFETERQAKAYAILDIALAQSKNAIGEYSRSSEDFGNQQKLLNSRIQEFGVSLGTIFLPLATKIVGIVVKIAESLNSLSDTTKTVIVVIAGIAASIGPVLLGIGTFIKILPVLITGLGTLKAAIIAATGPFGLIAIAVAAAIPLLFELNTELNRTKNIKADVAQQLLTDRIEQTNLALADQLKRIKEIYPELNEEAKIRKVLKNELDALNKEGNKNSASYKAQRNAILDWGLAAIEASKGAEKLGESLGLIGGITEQLNNLNESRDLAKDQQEINLIDSKISKLEKQLVLINAISKRANSDILPALGVLEPRDNPFAGGLPTPVITEGVQTGPTAQMIKSAEAGKQVLAQIYADANQQAIEFNEMITQTLSNGISNAVTDLAFSIGEALASGDNVFSAIGQSLLNSIGSFLGDLGAQLIQVGVAGLAFATLIETIKTGGPLAIPAAIAAIGVGIALTAASGAFRGIAGKGLSGGGGSGGGSVGAGVSSQSFGGSGFSSNPINIGGEFVIKGPNLVYTINQTLNKNAKG